MCISSSTYFDGIVASHTGNYHVRRFTRCNQMLCIMYGQLGNRERLSDFDLTINVHLPKAYHSGFGKGISKANLANANENRNWQITKISLI